MFSWAKRKKDILQKGTKKQCLCNISFFYGKHVGVDPVRKIIRSTRKNDPTSQFYKYG